MSVTVSQTVSSLKNSLRHLYPDGEVNYIIRIIFEKLMNYSRTDLLTRGDNAMDPLTLQHINAIEHRLSAGEPIQYIMGEARFYGRDFEVNKSTLIPRPETEGLIDIIDKQNTRSDLRILDIGTGSGCIAITLARILKFPTIKAIDISSDALQVAERNAQKYHVAIDFIQADIFTFSTKSTFDIIVSNPPYICQSEASAMEKNVLDFEPHNALFVPDSDPLLFYKRIVEFANSNLAPGGGLYFEINPLYANNLKALLSDNGFCNIEIIEDFNFKNRYAIAHKPQSPSLFI